MDTESSAEEKFCRECGGNHAGPCGIEKVITAVSASLSKGFEGTTRWSISDTTAGLLKLFKRHDIEDAEDTIVGDEVQNRDTLEEIQEWLRWSIAAYEKDRATLLTLMVEQKLQFQDIMQLVATSAINQPAYFIAVYHARQCVVMSIRGTYNATDILTDLNPRTEPFQHGAAHTGILGAAKWLLEKEGPTLQNLLHDFPGYKLVLTGHSLGAAVAALLAMMIHASGPLARVPTKMERFFPAKVTSLLESNFPTTVGVPTSRIMCWGYGCAPCVDRTNAEETPYIYNVVLQDDVVPRVNPAAIEALRNEIQETSLSQGLKDGKKKKVVEKMERVNVGKVFKSGYQKLQNARMEHKSSSQESSNSKSNNSMEEAAAAVTTTTAAEADGEKPPSSDRSMDEPGTEAGIAAQAIMAVAEGPAATKQELESRRLFVPGNLFHIRRREKPPVLGPPMPAKPFEAGKEAPRNLKYKHHVIQGTTLTSRFGRIVLSSTMLSDHSCYSIRDGLLDAVAQLEQPSDAPLRSQHLSNPHVVVD